MMNKIRDTKVFCIGLDSATFDLIMPWVARGDLPNFAQLMKDGAYGDLESVSPPFSAQAWSSFMTGKNPGKHGIYGFKGFDERTRNLPFCLSYSIKSRTIWDILGAQDKKIICINMPMTYPPIKVNGLMISGRGTPGVYSDFTYPRELGQEIMKLTDKKYIIDLHWSGYLTSKKKIHAALKELHLMIEQRSEVARHLMKKYPWDLFTVVFMATDQIQHYFWKLVDPDHPQYREEDAKEFGNPVFEVYKRLDDEIGYFREEMDEDTTLIVFSDHGGGPLYDETIYLNEWLRRQGLFVPQRMDDHGGGKLQVLFRAILKQIWQSLSRHTSTSLKDHLVRLFPSLRTKVSAMVSLPAIDWSATKAFLAENVGTIRINRDVVSDENEYRELCSFLIREIERLENPFNGDKIVNKVYHRDEIYTGQNVSLAPDLLVETKDNAYLIEKKLVPKSKEVVLKAKQWRGISGDHRYNGILLMAGKSIVPGRQLKGSSLMDVTPTILALLHVGIPEDMDGRVLTSALTQDFLEKHPPEFQKGSREWEESSESETYSEQDAGKISDQLRGLGYIE